MDSNNNELIVLDDNTIKDLIYEIRGQKVMLDFDLAKIYGYSTKRFNQQVKNNINKFPEDFMFQLNEEECEKTSWSKFLTLNKSGNKRGYNIKYLPYAFTEQGIYMLMTVLKGELAVQQSITLIRLFQAMKDYIVENNNLVTTNEILKLSRQVNENTLAIAKLKESDTTIKAQLDVVMDNFIDKSTYKHFLILDGQRVEADIAFRNIYSLAQQSILLIDDYIDIRTLKQLKSCNSNISITICSDNVAKEKVTDIDITNFKADTGIDIAIKPTNNKIHDRFIVIDYKTDNETIYLSGSSGKDAGKRITTIIKIDKRDIYHPIIDELLIN